MMHPRTRTGRSLVGLVLVLLGLSTYGCGDTGTSTEPATLGNLSVSEGTLAPQFNPDTTSYTVQLSTDVSSTTITATPRVAGDTIRIDNQPTSSKTVTLDSPGAEQSVNIVVTETGTGGTSKSYTVRVKRASLAGDNSLGSLTVAPGTLAPPFNKNSLPYTVSVVNNIGSIAVTPTLSDPAATMTVNGQPTNSGQSRTINLSGGGQVTTITITVTAQDESTKSYVIAVSRGASSNNNLQGLATTPGTLDPSFRADRTGYTINLPATLASNVTNVRLTPSLQDTTATMTVNGQRATSGQAQTTLLPAPGSNVINNIIVVAENGTTKVYTVNVIRDPLGGNNNLQSLTVSPTGLTPAFTATTTSYTLDVGSGVGSVTVTPQLQDTAATLTVTSNGQISTSGQTRTITLRDAGLSTTINILVRAPNGSEKTYAITVDRATPPPPSGNNNLQSLTVTSHTLSPTFSRTRTRSDYELEVGSNVESLTVNATPQDGAASVSFLVNNAPRTNPISLPPGPSTTEIEIVVKAPNGTEKSYFISTSRDAPSSNANLSALRMTAGPSVTNFSSPFASNTATVAPEIGEVVVRATKEDENATMAIGSVTVPAGTPSGQATFTLNGAGGEPTTISFTVTPQSGINPKTYTISVIRPAAPTPPAPPTSAPDLLTADDSCPLRPDLVPPPTGTNADCAVDTAGIPFGTRDDDKTNVKRPRFTIPQPTAGTPSLYVGTHKDTFDPGTTTLTPSVDLSKGNNTITYTLTNEGGESDPSPPLTVTFDTSAPVQ